MTISAVLAPLPRADGSATFKSGLTTVIASVSGPMEVRAREELPDKAFIEVIVRPACGVGSTRERALEARLLSAISPIIIRSHHPRMCIQINIQLVEAEDHSDTTAILPAVVNAAMLALIDAGTPVNGVLVSTLVESESGRHVLAFEKGRCVLVESQGEFDIEDLEKAVKEGGRRCSIEKDEGTMDIDEQTVGMVIREAIEKKVKMDMRWRE
ncbi:ribosomal protein S5 domain 2-type protein [Pyronema omphalodes]|nr:ribosomal protein S5 domain 2-type protein [Pyronema omphalodes]